MVHYLSSDNFKEDDDGEEGRLAYELEIILRKDGQRGVLPMLADYKQILSDNARRDDWDAINARLMTLFKCGRAVPLDGPMIGVSMSIRDTDYFKETARVFGKDRSVQAQTEWMASVWNATFGSTGIWMGKTFEPVAREAVARLCDNHPSEMDHFDPEHTRIGRNFFRQPHNPTLLQMAGLTVLTPLFKLKDRPLDADAQGFDASLSGTHLKEERVIPYSKTGGYFLGNPGISVLPEMNGKAVYQLNYRWPGLGPVYPMTRLVDELVQVDTGIYLGQLTMATRNYSLGRLTLPFLPSKFGTDLGVPYDPSHERASTAALCDRHGGAYGYQNNGFFLLIDPQLAKDAYADDVFPYLRPHPGEMGYTTLGYDRQTQPGVTRATTGIRSGHGLVRIADWKDGWTHDAALNEKFTTFTCEPSPKADDPDVRTMRREGESILQMLQRLQAEIGAQSRHDDRLVHFECLNRLFRSGVAPTVRNGMFQGCGKGFNVRFSGLRDRSWYGKRDPLMGFDCYHGATLNLHWGFGDAPSPGRSKPTVETPIFPTALAALLRDNPAHPNVLDALWSGIARFIFPWAGKSFECIGGRKLSMLLDEGDALRERYPERVEELKRCLASRPHYDLIKKNARQHWPSPGAYADHLKTGGWDTGMSQEDKTFWETEADRRWVYGNNLMDSRVESADGMMRLIDINYRCPESPLIELTESGPSPFVRMGYSFLGQAGASSILAMNNGPEKKKTVFQFHYRFPLIGGPVPIGACLDEIVEIAQGLYLGQLIYSTKPWIPFHSSLDPEVFAYRLFGYFLLLDDDWEYHRQAIGFDVPDALPAG